MTNEQTETKGAAAIANLKRLHSKLNTLESERESLKEEMKDLNSNIKETMKTIRDTIGDIDSDQLLLPLDDESETVTPTLSVVHGDDSSDQPQADRNGDSVAIMVDVVDEEDGTGLNEGDVVIGEYRPDGRYVRVHRNGTYADFSPSEYTEVDPSEVAV